MVRRRALVGGVLCWALGCASAPDAAPVPVMVAKTFVNRSPGDQLGYLTERLPQACVAEAETVAGLGPFEGAPRLEVSGSYSVQAETLVAVADWLDRATARTGSVDVHRRFGTDATMLDLIQRELAVRLLVAVRPQDWQLERRLGEVLRAQRLHGEARQAFRAAVTKAPDAAARAAARFYVGSVSEDLGDLTGAQDAYEAALAEDPSCHGARFNLALLCFRRGDAMAARNHLAEARKRRPDDPDVRVALGQLDDARGDMEGALLNYGEAVALAPREPLYRLTYASALVKLERYREAMQEFARVRAENPDNRLALFGMGMAAARMGDVARAREHLGDFIAASRRDPSLSDEVAQAQDQLVKLGG